MRQVCIAIRDYLRRTGNCYRDVAVIAGDLAAYASFLERTAALYDIPIYLDQTRGIVLNPFIEYLKSALQIVTRNFTYESVFHYIRSGLADFTPEEADRVENYVLATGVRGKKRWQTIFVRKTPDMDNELEALEGLNVSRQKLVEQMEPLMQTFTDTQSLVMGLYGFIEKNEVQVKLKAYEEQF